MSPLPHPALFRVAVRDAIFEHLDTRSLVAAARVCRAWTIAATALLWRAPPPAALFEQPLGRVASYAPAIRRLEIVPHNHQLLPADDDCSGSNGALSATDQVEDVDNCVYNFLEFVALSEVVMHVAALHTQLRCTLGVVHRWGHGVTSAAIRSLTLAEALDDIYTNNKGVSDAHDDSVDSFLLAGLRALGKLPRLASLEIDATLRPSLLHFLAGAQSNGFNASSATHLSTPATWLFRSLQRLTARVYPSGVAPLVAAFRAASLAHLDLAIMPSMGSVVPALTPLKATLRTLRIAFNCCYRLTRCDVAALSRMTRLTELRLQGGPWARLSRRRYILALDVADADLYGLLASLPELVALELQCSSGGALTANAVGGIGLMCPRLRHLRLDRVFCDTHALVQHQRYLHRGDVGGPLLLPLFPELETLCLWTTGFQGVDHR
jgi:hypothetical protein